MPRLPPFILLGGVTSFVLRSQAQQTLAVPPSPSAAERRMQPPLPSVGRFLNDPRKMEIHNTETGEFIKMLFNPSEMEESITTNWTSKVVVGQSHERLQFVNTESDTFQFMLEYDALKLIARPGTTIGSPAIVDAQQFLQSLGYPTTDGAPPRVLLFWPNFMTMTCVVRSQRYRYQKWFADGSLARFSVELSVSEIRDVRLTSSQVRLLGLRRVPEPRRSPF